MAKKSYNIDLTKSPAFPFGTEYLPAKVEPVSFGGRQRLSDNLKVIDMQNILPTPEGYTSFFGLKGLSMPALPAMTERVFTYRDAQGNNTLIALGKYGLIFTTDGVAWDYSQSNITAGDLPIKVSLVGPEVATAKVSGSYTIPGVTTPSYYLTMPYVDSANPSKLRLHMTSTNTTASTYKQPYAIEMPVDIAYNVLDPLTEYLKVDPNTKVVAGDLWHLVAFMGDSVYQVQLGDTMQDVLVGLTGIMTSKLENVGKVQAAIVREGVVSVTASATTNTQSLHIVHLYKEPSNITTMHPLGTMLNDEVPLHIPASSMGNLGMVVYGDPAGLPANYAGTVKLGTAYDSGRQAGQSPLDTSRWGDMSRASLTKGGSHFVPLTHDRIGLRQYTGTVDPTFSMEVFDLGIPLEGTRFGAFETKYAINTRLSTSTLLAGDVLAIHTRGQSATHTVTATELINAANNGYSNIKASLVAAYNAAGSYAISVHGDYFYSSDTSSRLYVMVCPRATNVRSIFHTSQYNISPAQLRKTCTVNILYELEILLGSANQAVRLAGIYKLMIDDEVVPVFSPTGLFSDPLTGGMTGTQIKAAATAGTKLQFLSPGRHWAVVSDVDVGSYPWVRIYKQTFLGVVYPPVPAGPYSGCYKAEALTGEGYIIEGTSVDGLRIASFNEIAKPKPVNSPYLYGNIYDQLTVYHHPTPAHRYLTSPLPKLPEAPVVVNYTATVPIIDISTTPGIISPRLSADLDIGIAQANKVVAPSRASLLTMSYINPETLLVVSPLHSIVYESNLYIKLVAVTLTQAYMDSVNVINPWSIATVKNSLYCYRKGLGHIKHYGAATSTWAQLIPNFVTIAQIQGICEARGRLLLWDTANALSTSATLDLMDFVPAIKTRANVVSVNAIVGDIVVVLPIAEGFIIYATSSIVLAKYVGGTETFKFTAISNTQGVLNSKAVVSASEGVHYAITGEGLIKVTPQGITAVSSDFDLYVQSSKVSPRLDFLQGRYLTASFSPDKPGWTNSKVNAYSGVTIGGSPAIPGTIGAIIPGITVPDALIYPKGFTVTVPPINIPAISGVLGAGVIAPDVQLPSLNVAGIIGELVPERLIFGVAFPSIPATSLPVNVPAPLPATSTPVRFTVNIRKFVPYVISGYIASYTTTDPAGGPIYTFSYETRNISWPSDLVDHYKWHVRQGIYVPSTPGNVVTRPKNAGGFLTFGGYLDPNGYAYQSLGTSGQASKVLHYNYVWRANIYPLAHNEVVTGYRESGGTTQKLVRTDTVSWKFTANNHAYVEPTPKFVDNFVTFEGNNLQAQASVQHAHYNSITDEYLFAKINSLRPLTNPWMEASFGKSMSETRPEVLKGLSPWFVETYYYKYNIDPKGYSYYNNTIGTGGIGSQGIAIEGVPPVQVPAIPGYNTGDNVLLGSTLNQATKPYTIPGLTITRAMRAAGYQIPGYTYDLLALGAPIVRPGYTIPDYKLPDVPNVPAVPAITIPGGNFVTTSGSREPVDPTYTRALILDTKLNNWGSFDSVFKSLIDFSPINSRSVNPITQGTATQYTYQNLAKSIGVLDTANAVSIATSDNLQSTLTIGNIGYSQSGTTRLLDAIAGFVNNTDNAVLEVLGSIDGEHLSSQLIANVNTQNGVARLHKVLTGKWFRIRITGKFNLKSLVFSGELGGTR